MYCYTCRYFRRVRYFRRGRYFWKSVEASEKCRYFRGAATFGGLLVSELYGILKLKGLMHAVNDLPTNIGPACLAAAGSEKYMSTHPRQVIFSGEQM